MTQPPKPERNRRASRTPAKPEPVMPVVRKPRAPQTKQPIGRSEELRARQEEMRQTPVYGHSTPLQGRAPVQNRAVPQFSDFDDPVINPKKPVRPARKPKNGHTILWLVVALICLAASITILITALPQITGKASDGASVAFVDGGMIRRDDETVQKLREAHAALVGDVIFNGIYIDGVHVGGMTRQQAIDAVYTMPGGAGSEFDIMINVGGTVYSANSQNVPLYRNVEEVVTQAYALGRQNSTELRNSGVTPLKERWDSVQYLAQNPVAFYTVTTYDHGVVREIADSIAAQINRDPVNATVSSFDVSSKSFTYDSDISGLYVSADDIYNNVVGRLDSGVYYDTVYVEPQELVASVTKAELMNSFGLISSFTTETTSDSNRNTNIDLAAQAINGMMLLPGETFSFNQATGQRTSSKGYKPAAAIAGGETFDEVGGGVCQTSTTLFNAAVRANMTIVDRDPHAWPSTYVPKGEDATVNWPNLDFRFRNDSEGPIFIVAKYAKRKVTVEIYGITLGDGVTIDLDSEVVYTKDPPSEPLYVQNPELPYGTEKVTVKARTGYKVETYKVWYRNGEEFKREKLHTSNYKMYQKTIEWN